MALPGRPALRGEDAIVRVAKKMAGWLWVGTFYVFVLVLGLALVGGGTVLAVVALQGVLQNDAWRLIGSIALVVASVVAFVGGLVLLFRITDIPVPGRRFADNADARTTEYGRYTDATVGTHGGGGGGYEGGGGGGN